MEDILHQLISYPIIFRVLYIPGGAGFLPSTVGSSHKCQPISIEGVSSNMAQNRALQFTVFYPSDVDGTQGGSLPRMDPDIIQSWNPGKFGKQFGEFYAAIFQGGSETHRSPLFMCKPTGR